MSKKFILNACDFGMSSSLNTAVLEGYTDGILRSASLVANGKTFNEAIENIIPQCPELGVGIHLNITEGKALCGDIQSLTDSNGNFNNSYVKLLLKSLNTKDKTFMEEVEREFRRQIEKVLSKHKNVTHIDSHDYIHSIPKIFKMVCRLAKEYGINQIETQYEKPYIVPDLGKYFCFRYFENLFKLLVFNIFTIMNENIAQNENLKTNDYLIGITYQSMMDALTVSCGVMAIKYDNIVVEASIHPCRYEDGTIDNYFDEYLLTKNKKLKRKIEKMGYKITNYAQEQN